MDAYTILKIVASSFSFIGSSIIIILYFKLGMRQNFALKLITYLSVGDLIFSISNLMYIYPGNPATNDLLCQFQGFLIQFSEQTCFCFCFMLCLSIYQTVLRNKQIKQRPWIYLLIGFGVPFICALIPLITQSYGTQTYVCGIGRDDVLNETAPEEQSEAKVKYWVQAGLLFYLPLWALGLANIYFIIRVTMFIFKLRQKSESTETVDNPIVKKMELELELSQQITINMIAYPIIMLFCWSGNTIYAISSLCGDPIQFLFGARFVMADCYGLLNSIAYVINTMIILKFKKTQEELFQEKALQMQQVKTQSHEKIDSSFLSIGSVEYNYN